MSIPLLGKRKLELLKHPYVLLSADSAARSVWPRLQLGCQAEEGSQEAAVLIPLKLVEPLTFPHPAPHISVVLRSGE